MTSYAFCYPRAKIFPLIQPNFELSSCKRKIKNSSYKEVHIGQNLALDSFALLDCFISFQFTSHSFCLKVSIELP